MVTDIQTNEKFGRLFNLCATKRISWNKSQSKWDEEKNRHFTDRKLCYNSLMSNIANFLQLELDIWMCLSVTRLNFFMSWPNQSNQKQNENEQVQKTPSKYKCLMHQISCLKNQLILYIHYSFFVIRSIFFYIFHFAIVSVTQCNVISQYSIAL